jgi:hypothetical protein
LKLILREPDEGRNTAETGKVNPAAEGKGKKKEKEKEKQKTKKEKGGKKG